MARDVDIALFAALSVCYLELIVRDVAQGAIEGVVGQGGLYLQTVVGYRDGGARIVEEVVAVFAAVSIRDVIIWLASYAGSIRVHQQTVGEISLTESSPGGQVPFIAALWEGDVVVGFASGGASGALVVSDDVVVDHLFAVGVPVGGDGLTCKTVCFNWEVLSDRAAISVGNVVGSSVDTQLALVVVVELLTLAVVRELRANQNAVSSTGLEEVVLITTPLVCEVAIHGRACCQTRDGDKFLLSRLSALEIVQLVVSE